MYSVYDLDKYNLSDYMRLSDWIWNLKIIVALPQSCSDHQLTKDKLTSLGMWRHVYLRWIAPESVLHLLTPILCAYLKNNYIYSERVGRVEWKPFHYIFGPLNVRSVAPIAGTGRCSTYLTSGPVDFLKIFSYRRTNDKYERKFMKIPFVHIK